VNDDVWPCTRRSIAYSTFVTGAATWRIEFKQKQH